MVLSSPFSTPPFTAPTLQPKMPEAPTRSKIFIVHGHNQALRVKVQLFIERAGHEALVLKEQSAPGQTLVDELLRVGPEASFAVVLLTADDVGKGKTEPGNPKPRARQNVILELGYFLGQFRLLSKRKVAMLCEPGVEPPSDLGGVIYIAARPDDDSDGWRIELAKALKGAGLGVNQKALR